MPVIIEIRRKYPVYQHFIRRVDIDILMFLKERTVCKLM